MSLFCIANKYVIRVTIIINKVSINNTGSIDIGEIVAAGKKEMNDLSDF